MFKFHYFIVKRTLCDPLNHPKKHWIETIFRLISGAY